MNDTIKSTNIWEAHFQILRRLKNLFNNIRSNIPGANIGLLKFAVSFSSLFLFYAAISIFKWILFVIFSLFHQVLSLPNL